MLDAAKLRAWMERLSAGVRVGYATNAPEEYVLAKSSRGDSITIGDVLALLDVYDAAIVACNKSKAYRAEASRVLGENESFPSWLRLVTKAEDEWKAATNACDEAIDRSRGFR